jgi:O-antigen/teichoic acid export membrane protein
MSLLRERSLAPRRVIPRASSSPIGGDLPSGAPLDEAASKDSRPRAEAGANDVLATSAAGPRAVRGAALRVGGYIAGALVSAVSAALLFRHLGVTMSGRYVLAVSLVAIVGAISDLGLTAVGVRELSNRPTSERSSLARDLLGLRITLTVIGGTIVTAVAADAYSVPLGAGVGLACVGLLLQTAQDNFALPFVVDLRLGTVSALDLTRQLLVTMLIAVLVAAGAGLLPFLAIPIPVGFVVAVATARLVRGVRPLTPTFSWTRWRRFMGAVLPYSAAVAASALYFRVSILLVSAMASGRQAGYFGTSFRIIEVLVPIPALLAASAFPIFARAAYEDHARLGYALGGVFQVSLIAGAWAAVSIAVGAPLMMQIVGGSEFAAAAPVLAIQGVGLGAMFVSLVWANALLSLGVYRQILAISVLALAVNVALAALLIPLDGARGAAIGTTVAEIIVALVQACAVIRGRPGLFPSLRTVPFVLLAAGLGLVPLALTGLPVIARLVISTALFGTVILGTRAVPRELLDVTPWPRRRRVEASA